MSQKKEEYDDSLLFFFSWTSKIVIKMIYFKLRINIQIIFIFT